MATLRTGFSALLILLLAVSAGFGADLTASLKAGKADMKSAGALAFGPDGVLFVGDSQGGAIFALDTQDCTPGKAGAVVDIKAIGDKVAGLLGTTPDQMLKIGRAHV